MLSCWAKPAALRTAQHDAARRNRCRKSTSQSASRSQYPFEHPACYGDGLIL